MWIDPKEMSSYAFHNCLDDNFELVSCITDPYYAYLYCVTFKDDPEVSENLKGSKLAIMYCLFVNQKVNVKEFITDPKYLKTYYKTKMTQRGI